MSQVLIKKPILHGHITQMVKADVISTVGDMLTVRIGKVTQTVKRSEVQMLAGPKNVQIRRMPSPAKNSISKF